MTFQLPSYLFIKHYVSSIKHQYVVLTIGGDCTYNRQRQTRAK